MARTEMLIGGRWTPAAGPGRSEDVTSPYDGSVVGTVPVAGVDDVEAALAAVWAWAALAKISDPDAAVRAADVAPATNAGG